MHTSLSNLTSFVGLCINILQINIREMYNFTSGFCLLLCIYYDVIVAYLNAKLIKQVVDAVNRSKVAGCVH